MKRLFASGTRPLWGVSATAFLMIFLEVVQFQQLHFVSNYLEATLAIAIALLGIAVGGVVAFPVAERNRDRGRRVASLMMAPSILIAAAAPIPPRDASAASLIAAPPVKLVVRVAA